VTRNTPLPLTPSFHRLQKWFFHRSSESARMRNLLRWCSRGVFSSNKVVANMLNLDLILILGALERRFAGMLVDRVELEGACEVQRRRRTTSVQVPDMVKA
jgi:hypothetical protein